MPDIIDISFPVSAKTAVFPGDTAFQGEQIANISETCPVNIGRVTMSAHCGTHADAPYHYSNTAPTSEQADLSTYIGAARVIDIQDHDRDLSQLAIVKTAIEQAKQPCPPRVLLRLLETNDPEIWPTDFAGIEPELIDYLASVGVILIGVDTPSIDPETSKTMDAHHRVLHHDMRILEHLQLCHVEPNDYELIALPLHWVGMDATPMRAVLRTL